jgi:hypothetical protein
MMAARRIAHAFMLAIPACLLATTAALAQGVWLPAWNEGPAKQAIVKFVQATTDPSGAQFVPPAQRIATFDQDGTLWVEHPIYSQVLYCLDRVRMVVAQKPELANVEPFKTVLSGDREAIARLSKEDLGKILAAALTGMSVEQFQTEVTSSPLPGTPAGNGPIPISPTCRCRSF